MIGPSVAVTELSGFRADWFGLLPASASFACRVPSTGMEFVVTTSAARYAALRAAGGVVFDPSEWVALVVVAESDRATVGTLMGWLRHKQAVRYWMLKQAEAMGGCVDVAAPRGWPVGRVLRAYGAELVRVLA